MFKQVRNTNIAELPMLFLSLINQGSQCNQCPTGQVLEKIPGSGSGSGRVGVLKIGSGIFGYLFYSRVIPGIPGISG